MDGRKGNSGGMGLGIPERYGVNEKTLHGARPAVRLYNIYRQRRGKITKFEDMSFQEIETDNLENEIKNFAKWCSSTPIPRKFDDNLQPPRASIADDAPITLNTTTTLSQYIGRILTLLRDIFPGHPDFANLHKTDHPTWWTRLRPVFEHECDRFLFNLKSDYTFGETMTRPLYSTNNYIGLTADDAAINDLVSLIDLCYILKHLLRGATYHFTPGGEGKLQQRAWIAITFLAMGRGGEIKFTDTADMMYHPRVEVTDLPWSESKTLNKYAMPMIPNKDNYLYDFYHCLGSFWAVEGGLFRNENERNIQSFLFPFLHGLKNATVSKKITDILRDNLPNGCPPVLVKSISSKSIQRGGISQLIIHPDLNNSDICGRSGHASGSNIDLYTDDRNIARGIRGGRALAEFSVGANVRVPRFECLGTDTQSSVNSLVEKLFVVSLPEFLPRGMLHSVLRISAASLVMYHNQLTSDFTPANAVATKLRNTAREANIADIAYPNTAPEVILNYWSQAICDDFCILNPDIAPASPDIQELTKTVNKQSEVLSSMHLMVKQLVRDNQRKDLRYEAQQQQLSHLSNELATAKNELARVRAREAMMADLVHATTPTDRRSTLGRNVRPRLEHDSQLFPAGHDGGPGEMLSLTRMCTTTAKGSPQKYDAGTPQSAAAQGASDVCSQNEGQSTPQNPQPVARPLMFGAEAREISEKPCTIKG